jgi:hypothetical protein
MNLEINLNNTVQVLSDVIDRQLLLYAEVFNISKEQEKAIEEDNEIKLLELIDAKNDLMKKANDLNVSAAPFREYWDNNFENISPEIKELLKTKVISMSEIIKKILAHDESTKRTIENIQTEKNSKNIQQTNIKKLKSAYGSAPVKDQFIDKSK